jgi:orotate phosphoribosyltransferase
MSLKREFKLSPGERVLVVEDVLTTGLTTSEVVALAQAYGAKVIGVAAVIDRSTTPLAINVPVRALVTYPVKAFPPDVCDLCARKVPLSRLGRQDILDFLPGE